MALALAKPGAPMVKVGVQSFSDDYMEIEVDRAFTAGQLKAHLKSVWSVDPAFQKLHVGEAALSDNKPLSVHVAPGRNKVVVRVTGALEPFMADLSSPDASSRARALAGMANVGLKANRSAIWQVQKTLSDPDPSVRCLGVKALGSIVDRGDRDVIKALVQCLDDKDPTVPAAASDALREVAEKGDEATIREVFSLLGRANWKIRDAAVETVASLAERGDEVAVGEALSRLEHPDWHVREAAAWAVVAVAPHGDQEVAAVLRACGQQDPSQYVRRAAMQALAVLEG